MSDLHMDVFGSGPPAVFIHGSFGWGLDTFPEQRALADDYRICLLDRRGFGQSPPAETTGWQVDMHDVVAVLKEEGGAHLVGHSYGGVVAMLAATRAPEHVRTLTVIEPPALDVTPSHPAVAAFFEALRPVYESAAASTAEEFFRRWQESNGRPADAIDKRLTSMSKDDWMSIDATRRESMPAGTPLDLAALAATPFPKVVVRGGWPDNLVSGNNLMRDALGRIAEEIGRVAGAREVTFPNSTHNPQLQEPAAFNALLREVFRSG